MPTFRVLRRVDAWIDYVAEVEAENPEIASSSAAQQDAARLAWKRVGQEEFWNARFVTLDENGDEIPETVIMRG